MSTKSTIEKEIKYLFAELQNYKPAEPEYKEICDRIARLQPLLTEEERIETEKRKNAEDFAMKKTDLELKAEQHHDDVILQNERTVSEERNSKRESRSRIWGAIIPAILGLLGTIGSIFACVSTGLYMQKKESDGELPNRRAEKFFDKVRLK